MIEAAIGTFVFILFLFAWVGFERIVKFGMLVDLVVHGTLIWMFLGTYAGMMTGILAATLTSCFLQVMRRYYRRKRRFHEQARQAESLVQQIGSGSVHSG